MTPERRQRVEELYHQALACPESGRAAFLADACHGDESLRALIESLLSQPSSIHNLLGASTTAPRAADVGPPALSGRRLGAYLVRECIGIGGMGEKLCRW